MNIDILLQVLKPETALFAVFGVLLGIVFGAIPGLNGLIGVSMLLPITFTLPPAEGLLLLGGIYMGGMYGGSITAILINVPGSVEATCTAWDGYPLAEMGRAREALYYSIYASTFGGLVSAIAMIFFTPSLAKMALKFGPPEMFLLGLCGLTVVGVLASQNIWKSMFALSIGILLKTVGIDIMTTTYRFTFGIRELKSGFNITALVIGLFCFAEMFRNIGQKKSATFVYKDIFIKRITALKLFFKKWFILIKSTLLGFLIGILPGIGGGTAIFVAYGEAKRSSSNPELFGKGNVEGIIAAESANNAVVGGSLIPLLALGIPGSSTAAIIGAALTSHGLIMGPNLFAKSQDVAYIFMYGMLVAVLAMAIVGIYGISLFPNILKIKMFYIIPAVLVFSLFGAYSVNFNTFDIFYSAIAGIMAVLFVHMEIPLSPIIIGFVLENLIEDNFRRSIVIANAQNKTLFGYIAGRPLCLIILAVLIIFSIIFLGTKKKKRANVVN